MLKLARLRHARRKVSWTRSSESSNEPQHPVAVHLQLPPVALDELRERRLVAGLGGGNDGVRLALAHIAASRAYVCGR